MKRFFIRIPALFFLGMMAGGILISVNIGGQVDEITHENELLRRQLELCQDELNQLKKSMGENEKKIVSSIEPDITIIGENMARLEEKNAILFLDKQVRQWLEPVKGQDLEKLNYLLVPQIIDNRKVEYDGSTYQLTVKLVVIDANIIVYIDAEKQKLTRPVVVPPE
jgi:hypothetical protein